MSEAEYVNRNLDELVCQAQKAREEQVAAELAVIAELQSRLQFHGTLNTNLLTARKAKDDRIAELEAQVAGLLKGRDEMNRVVSLFRQYRTALNEVVYTLEKNVEDQRLIGSTWQAAADLKDMVKAERRRLDELNAASQYVPYKNWQVLGGCVGGEKALAEYKRKILAENKED